ncbi:MAG TPA: glycosyltransferase family 1 protein [Flavitalea sp.]|nr:glycosyltransferase family 1 protein [Flavitalea sp.]
MNKLNGTNGASAAITDLVCFSHLRWNFVFQRPQHLLSRFAKEFRVFFIEEPIFDSNSDSLLISLSKENVWVVVPHLSRDHSEKDSIQKQKELLSRFFINLEINHYIFWYYTPMALSFTDHFTPELIVFDNMDELSAFRFAPPELIEKEKELLSKADIVFTGGHSLYEAKKNRHDNIHAFPSSIDKSHFAKARVHVADPEDQSAIPHPRIGFYGVIDERMDLDLISQVAEQRPDLHFIMIGPVLKIDSASLPRPGNIHYLGSKCYEELPSYLGGWDIAMIPFALNESTRYISPTKTPEYLAAGKPVISTSIRDVINPYGNNNHVHIADTPDQFIQAVDKELNQEDKRQWLANVDEFLADNSWDSTWQQMMQHIKNKLEVKPIDSPTKKKEHVYV